MVRLRESDGREKACPPLVKKIDVFSAEKNGNTWRKLALFSANISALNVAQLPCTAELP